MGLQAKATAAIAKAFDTSLADAVKSFTYRVETPVFDPVTNTTTTTSVDYTGRGVFDAFKEALIKDTSVLDTKVKVTVLKDELAVDPVKNALIITSDKVYTIEAVMIDPADVAWTLKCRQ